MWNKLVQNTTRPLLWIVSGPSGSGKTTLCAQLLAHCPQSMVRSVSFTTRPKKPGEKNGRDYHFISRTEFIAKQRRGEFIEWEEVFGNLYGTSKHVIAHGLRRKKDVVLPIDVKGGLHLKKIFPKQSVLVFVVPRDLKQLKERLLKRAREKKQELHARLSRIAMELAYAKRYEYIVVNDNLAQAVRDLKAIIIAKHLENER